MNKLYTEKVLIAGILIEVLLGFFIIYFFGFNNQEKVVISNEKSNKKVVADVIELSPTPIPFYELTIPYLRERIYESGMDNLEFSYETGSYTAYVTSYESDGLTVNGLLTKPKSEMPDEGYPAIVFVHGYIPPSTYQTIRNYNDYVDYLARNDFVVFKIDLRGHGNSEGEPGGAYYSSDYIIDTLSAYSALESSEFVNPQGIGLWGHSMAGNVVMRSFAAKPEIPGVVIMAGAVYTYTDFREYRINDSSYQRPDSDSDRVRRRESLIAIHGDPESDSDFWQMVAPTSYLSDLEGAIQIHHAVNDPVVSIEYTRNLKSLLENTDVLHEIYEYSNGGHNLTGASFNQSMQRTVDFFSEHLR